MIHALTVDDPREINKELQKQGVTDSQVINICQDGFSYQWIIFYKS